MALVLVTPPSIEPVSLDDMHDFLRIDANDTSNDALLTGLIIAARQWAEVFCQRRFITQTWKLLFDFFPGYIDLKLSGSKISSPFVSGSNAVLVGIRYAIVLPYPIVQSVTNFQYLNANGTTTVMNPSTDYVTDVQSQPARLTPPFGEMWPVARVVVNAIEVDYVCGYGSSQASVPNGIQLGIKMLAASWYENRIPDDSDIPNAVKMVLTPYRDLRF